jgi:O-methyltransferase
MSDRRSGNVIRQAAEPRLRQVADWVARRTPYRITRRYPVDMDPATVELIESASSDSALSPARLAETIEAARYVHRHDLPGAIVECGVWRGETMAAIAKALLQLGENSRDLFLYDTFEGMAEPSEIDVMRDGTSARPLWEAGRRGASNEWALAPVEEVERRMLATGYDAAHIHLIKGKVEDTLPDQAPRKIALLRLDTDFYESTKHELIHLWPRLVVGGVLILDDYGLWDGARQAADEFFREQGIRIHLSRTDVGGRSAIKQAAHAGS